MSNDLDYNNPHFCPVYNKVIEVDLCYDSLMCLNGFFKVASTKELESIKDIKTARKICGQCPYSEL